LKTSQGTLHRADQPLEQFYFESGMQVVLPPDYRKYLSDPGKEFTLEIRVQRPNGSVVLVGAFIEKAGLQQNPAITFDFAIIPVDPVLHGPIQPPPHSLKDLEGHLQERGSGIVGKLASLIRERAAGTGLRPRPTPRATLLILDLPRVRNPGEAPEKNELRGIFVLQDFVGIGIATKALTMGADGKAYNLQLVHAAGTNPVQMEGSELDSILLDPIEVLSSNSIAEARVYSGLPDSGAEFTGILAGVGALGGFLGDIWAREGWGNWTLIDDDILRPHNLARHEGKTFHIGLPKAKVVQHLMASNYSEGYYQVKSITEKASIKSAACGDVFQSASLLVDATTTFEVPRDLSADDSIPRIATAFLTPSGLDSVLLLESQDRTIRVSFLEAQYYRAILNEPFGERHLLGHRGDLVVGAGCRDISSAISNELVRLHGANLARRIRKSVAAQEARILVWSLNDDSGTIIVNEVEVQEPLESDLSEWKVYWDQGLRAKLRGLRSASLPSETGGVLLGYHDMKLKTVHLVDALPAPADSLASESGFTRGTVGLKDAIQKAASKTGNIVNYVGEWHSHPRNSSSSPSLTDLKLFAHHGMMMAQDGVPVVMGIIGERDETFTLCMDEFVAER
jgi:integrative and conjugative element protein (TIGR02256 family)